jgi:signal transduction histidine kinase
LSQVVINLIKNAFEAMDTEGGSCILKAEKKLSGEILIMVEDTGKGIPDAQKEKIFLPFFTTRENGSGIGLSLARQIMRLHKGNIDVSSEEGKGTKFTLLF